MAGQVMARATKAKLVGQLQRSVDETVAKMKVKEKGKTQKEAMREIRSLGLTVRRTEFGEFRVNYKGGSEATAYYTDDAEDAVGTAKAMAHGHGA